MPEYLAPGVYVEEEDAQQPIEGVSTSVTGFVGVTQRGPLDTEPAVLVTSFPEFERTFGGYFTPNFSPAPPANSPPLNMLPHAAAGFFKNGGKLLYIKRVASRNTAPVAAAASLENTVAVPTLMTRLTSNANVGATTLQLASLRGIQNGTKLVLTQVKNGVTSKSPGTLTVASYDDASGQLTLSAALQAPPVYEAAFTDVTVTTKLKDNVNVGNTLTLATLRGLQNSEKLILTQTKPGSAPITSQTLTVTHFDSTNGVVTFSPPLPVGSPTFEVAFTKVAVTLLKPLQNDVNGGVTTFNVDDSLGIQAGETLVLTQVKNGVTTTSPPLPVQTYVDATGIVTLSAPLPPSPLAGYETQYTTVAVTADGVFTPVDNTNKFALQAADPGAWGNDITVQITPSSRPVAQAQIVSVGTSNDTLVLNSASNFYPGAIIEINTTTQKFYAKIKSVSGSGVVLTAPLATLQVAAISANLGAAPVVPVFVRTCEFDVAASYGTTHENFRGLTLDNSTPNFYATAIVNGSSLLTVPQSAPPAFPSDQITTDPSTMPIALDGLNVALTGGTDGGVPDPLDFVGEDNGPGDRTGIQALIDVSEISIIGAPGITDQQTQNELIAQCENLKYRFAILDPAPSATNGVPSLGDIQAQRNLYDTKYAAIYYPRLIVDDPLTDNPLAIPPSGHMAGIYAQTDDSRGVWKAPANVVIRGITDLELKVSKGEQEILNPEPNNICVLRDFRAQGRGLRVYGARCITSLTEWKYINVRRLFIFLEASLDLGTQWAVFEPNDDRLWNRLIQSVSAFLTTVWREGGLMGSKPEEAFFVKCGYDTMSQDDIENGRLIMLVGVAPVFPAEFVIIRIGQWAGGSSVQEL
jgi:uncharacterized protein